MDTIRVDGLVRLFSALQSRGFTVVGLTIQDRAIVYDELSSTADLPIGWTDRQYGGRYRLERRGDEARFGGAVGPHSWKRYLLPPMIVLWRARRDGDGFKIEESGEEAPKYACIGVRSCELHAIAVQDRVFLQGNHVDSTYKARRDALFVLSRPPRQAGDRAPSPFPSDWRWKSTEARPAPEQPAGPESREMTPPQSSPPSRPTGASAWSTSCWRQTQATCRRSPPGWKQSPGG